MADSSDTPTARATSLGRLRTWWAATCEIRELTRDVDREDALLAAAATHLVPGPWALGLLFRPRPRLVGAGEHPSGVASRGLWSADGPRDDT